MRGTPARQACRVPTLRSGAAPLCPATRHIRNTSVCRASGPCGIRAATTSGRRVNPFRPRRAAAYRPRVRPGFPRPPSSMMRPAEYGGTSCETCAVCAVAHLITLYGLRAHPSRRALRARARLRLSRRDALRSARQKSVRFFFFSRLFYWRLKKKRKPERLDTGGTSAVHAQVERY